MTQFISNLNNDHLPFDDYLNPPNDDSMLFSTTDFIDFDVNNDGFDLNMDDKKSSTWQTPSGTSDSNLLDADFTFDLNNFGSIGTGNASNGLSNYPLTATGQTSSITSPVSATSPAAPRVGEKRKSVTASNDESARVAAEEDKRRRNTAASARFRVKKKQREQALEKTAKEMTDRAQVLETKVQQLEMENKWLKGLITEREVGGESKVSGVIGKGALEELFEKYKRDERSKSSDADGEADE